jgi:hypothetical protein
MMQRVARHENVIQFVGIVMPPNSAVVTRLMQASVEDLLVRPGPKNIRSHTPRIQVRCAGVPVPVRACVLVERRRD